MRRLASAVALAALFARALPAQQAVDPLARALDLERVGRFVDAAAAFRFVLSQEPTNLQALLGSERVYTQLGRRDSIAAVVARALAADPRDGTARQIDVRTARAMGGEAMAAVAIARWMAAAPESEAPWREMVRSLLATGQTGQARQAVDAARRKLGDPRRMRVEMAQVEAADAHWQRAAQEWKSLVAERPELVPTAAFNLRGTPEDARTRLVAVLSSPDTSAAPRRLAADLMLGWEQPERAWALLQPALPADVAERRSALLAFSDRARTQDAPASRRVAAAALEVLAAISPGEEAADYRIESARSYAEAGDLASARRVLRAMADDPRAPPNVSIAAAGTLVEVEASEGDVADAARLLAANRDRLAGTEAARLGILVARAWIRGGDLARASATLEPDSSLAADEVRGWIALYRGDLSSARGYLKAGSRGDAEQLLDRASTLVLLQRITADSLPELGHALLVAVQGDSAGAARALIALGHSALAGGQPELLALAARYAFASRESALAESLWAEIGQRYGDSAPAPGALLSLARSEAARGETASATQRLESLILRYPDSALVPEARRELDRVRNLVPRS